MKLTEKSHGLTQLQAIQLQKTNHDREFCYRYDYNHNRIRNKIIDRDWSSAHLFVTQSARDHVGVQIQVCDLSVL